MRGIGVILTFFVASGCVIQRPSMEQPRLLDELPNTREATFSPDGREAIVTLENYTRSRTLLAVVRKKGKKWSYPNIVSFSGLYRDQEPAYTPDGLRLFFSSNRPRPGDTLPRHDMDIWMVSRLSLDASWGEPIHLGFPVNTDDDEMYPSVSANGNLYFTSNRPGGFGQEDIWLSRYMKGKYQAPEPLSDAINTEHFEYHALVSEDEQLILFSSYGRPGEMGGGDLYYSIRDEKGRWLPSIYLEGSNTPGIDYCYFSEKDRKNYYFSSDRCSTNPSPTRYRDIFSMLKQMPKDLKGIDSREVLPGL